MPAPATTSVPSLANENSACPAPASIRAGESVRGLLDLKRNEAFVTRLDACARSGEAHTEYELKYALSDEER